ncbi:MAG: cytochrome B [Salibacteraceae bacterium]
MTGLIHLHSSFRYLVLALIIAAIADALVAMVNDKPWSKHHKLLNLLALIFSHIQLLLGLILYIAGGKGLQVLTQVEGFMKEPAARFFAVEHIAGMLLAIALITVGYAKAKRAETDKKKHTATIVYYTLGLLIIFVMIPWPFMRDFGSWF